MSTQSAASRSIISLFVIGVNAESAFSIVSLKREVKYIHESDLIRLLSLQGQALPTYLPAIANMIRVGKR